MKIKVLGLAFIVVLLLGITKIWAELKEVADGMYLMIDNAEINVTGGPNGTVDFGAGGGSEVNVSTDNDVKYEGNSSIKVDYNALSGGYMWVARGDGLDASSADWSSSDVDWSKYNAISFYIHGEDSGTQIAFDVKDNGGEIWRYIFSDDFNGWKQIICPFSEFFARTDWQPDSADNNAVMNFPLKSYQFEPLAPGKGTFRFDQVEVIKQ